MKSYTITVNGNVYDVTVEENGAAPLLLLLLRDVLLLLRLLRSQNLQRQPRHPAPQEALRLKRALQVRYLRLRQRQVRP